MISIVSNTVGPVTGSVDVTGALTAAQAALAALRASSCYQQYKKNGTLPKSKLGECERDLLVVINKLAA